MKVLFAIGVFFLAIAAGAAPVLAHGQGRGMVRHQHVMQKGIPAAYRDARNPVGKAAAVVGQGRTLFAEHCASCHGAGGRGGAEAGRDLDPPAPELTHIVGMPMATDAFFLWTLADGGEALGTAMPAFKEVLSRQEIWAIVSYMRAGFPGR